MVQGTYELAFWSSLTYRKKLGTDDSKMTSSQPLLISDVVAHVGDGMNSVNKTLSFTLHRQLLIID